MAFLSLSIAIFLSIPIMEHQSPFHEFQWKKRLVIIYCDNQKDENFLAQKSTFENFVNEYETRDLIVFRFAGVSIADMESGAQPNINLKDAQNFLGVSPADKFRVFLIGKDGSIKLQSSVAITNETLFSIIDAMPMRQREMRDRAQ